MCLEGLEKDAKNQEIGSKMGSKKEANHGNPSHPRLARKGRKGPKVEPFPIQFPIVDHPLI